MPVAERLWRVFPWDQNAADGDRFSPQFVPVAATQGSGRCDLARSTVAVTYFAEAPEHAIAEMMQAFRGSTFDARDLVRFGQRLALVDAVIAPTSRAAIFDRNVRLLLRSIRCRIAVGSSSP